MRHPALHPATLLGQGADKARNGNFTLGNMPGSLGKGRTSSYKYEGDTKDRVWGKIKYTKHGGFQSDKDRGFSRGRYNEDLAPRGIHKT